MKNYGVVRFVDTCKPVPHGKDWIGISVGADKFNALTGGYCRYRKIGKLSDKCFYKITFKLDGKRYRFCTFGRDDEKMSAELIQWLCVKYLFMKELKELEELRSGNYAVEVSIKGV